MAKVRRSKSQIKATNIQKEIDKLNTQINQMREDLKIKEAEIKLLQELHKLYKGAS